LFFHACAFSDNMIAADVSRPGTSPSMRDCRRETQMMEISVKKILISAACVVMLSSTFAAAQSSQGKGGAAMTGETADPSKAPGAGMAPANQPKGTMSKDSMGTSGMSNSKNMGGANKNGDGQMTKGGMNK
jgi:hypothetical protein